MPRRRRHNAGYGLASGIFGISVPVVQLPFFTNNTLTYVGPLPPLLLQLGNLPLE